MISLGGVEDRLVERNVGWVCIGCVVCVCSWFVLDVRCVFAGFVLYVCLAQGGCVLSLLVMGAGCMLGVF